LTALADELDRTYRAVAARLPGNPAVRFEKVGDKQELVLSPLDKMDEPASWIALRAKVMGMLPRVDLLELILEIAARTRFTDAFTHISERTAGAFNLHVSICAVMMAEACNTGSEPLICGDVPAQARQVVLGGPELPARCHHHGGEHHAGGSARPLGAGQRMGRRRGRVGRWHALRGAGAVRAFRAEPEILWRRTQRNLVQPDIEPVFRAKRHHGAGHAARQPGPAGRRARTADRPSADANHDGHGRLQRCGVRAVPPAWIPIQPAPGRCWRYPLLRIETKADYGMLNSVSGHNISLQKIEPHWDDMLRLAGSLKLGRVPAAGIMRTLQVGERPTRLAQAIAEFGRIDKTLHTLNYIDDEAKRRGTLTQLNRGEGRHRVAHAVFHGKRGELRQHYREGQEDQLGSLGLVLNMIVLWNTSCMEARPR